MGNTSIWLWNRDGIFQAEPSRDLKVVSWAKLSWGISIIKLKPSCWFFLCTYSLFSSFSFFLAFTNFWNRISVIFHYKKNSWNKSEKNAKSSKIAREIRKTSDCQTLAIFRFLSRKLFSRAEGRMSQAESIQAENPSARLQLITKLNIYNLENEPKSSNVLQQYPEIRSP